MIVTIDGPAGAGKSTAARELATRLGFQFLDTGAMYRAVTWRCVRDGVSLEDHAAVTAAARSMELRLDADRVIVDGEDVTDAIRTGEITNETRHAAGNDEVRHHLTRLQREIAAGKDIVTEGRDQGTLAFPDAQCKFYVTANPRARALRRQQELAERGEQVSLDEILEQQALRDERDEQRLFGALKPAPDAIVIDTSDFTLAEVVDRLEQLVRAKAS